MTQQVSDASEAATGCANALILCLEWLRAKAPEATVHLEVRAGEWQDVELVPAVLAALDTFLVEHVRAEPADDVAEIGGDGDAGAA